MMSKTAIMLVVFPIFLSIIGYGSTLNLNDPCTNPAGKPGRCVFSRECQPLALICYPATITPEESNFVRQSHCGRAQGKALVCCEVKAESYNSKLPKPNQCGLDLADRPTGGPPGIDEYPWTALIRYRKPTGEHDYHCDGSLITSRYVVTAAHCINTIPKDWQVVGVRLGEHTISTKIDCDGHDSCADVPVDVDVESITVHEEYNPQAKSQWNDIALIRFTRDVGFSEYIQPICLPISDPEKSDNIVEKRMIAVGWGGLETASASDVKLKVLLDIVDPKGCNAVYRSSGVQLRDTQICAGGARGKDDCSADSGGPLMIRKKTNYFLYGIASFGPNKCGIKNVPGVYTNVPKYVDWIANNVK